ncbi:MAG TPA: mechanosensitive ion channel domain-containing protein [Gemmatimonadaceae bacterium]|nr:mechanosensitive ion channel domain-containing protein [Gemmatimonadaceae bacterium]
MQIDVTVAYNTAQRILLQLYQAIPRLLIATVVVVVLYYFGKLLRVGLMAGRDRWRGRENLELAVSRIFQSLVIAISLLIGATVVFPTVTAGGLIQLLGISGIAVGFAFKDIFQNFLAGILLLVTEPFSIGDEISVAGFEGTVEDVQTRATIIRTYDHRRVVVPNATLFTQSVVVNTAFAVRRSDYDLTISSSLDIESLKQHIVERLESSVEGVSRAPRPEVLILKTDATNTTLRIGWWAPPRQRESLAVQDRVLEAVRGEVKEEESRKQKAESSELPGG